ncbi:NUDIX hydrolase domain-like protein [Vararia minispora EC-137]|uniref:NUDIX hydrolase domain-like protein n=1 Tax=Vararia minispora EC-137 TaxID=1314806 RepID=A0ACB8R037_9AGAM|nr:NUDIX hydrolase domain-like protein [Vararia minispora EC-137]
MTAGELRHLSFLDLVKLCGNYRLASITSTARPVPFRATPDGPPVGLLLPSVLEALAAHNTLRRDGSQLEYWIMRDDSFVSFAPELSTPAARTRAMQETTIWWRDTGRFESIISPRLWRGEWYAVYVDPFGPLSVDGGDPTQEADDGENPNYAFSMERSACALFGVVTYGVHMTVYEKDDDGTVRIWVPRRSATKQTWPGTLDNSIAGGIPARSSPRWSLAKESMEEGSIPEALVDKYAIAVGAISYFFQTKDKALQPEVEFVYDMCVPKVEGLRLSPGDTEVETFKLMPLEEVIEHMHAGEFKPNCALVLIDFLIRNGYLTPDNEPHYLDIITRMHDRFSYEHW